MGLEDDVDVPESALASGGEGGSNLGGVVAVVVDDGDAGGFAAQLEAAIDAVKAAEAFGDFVGGDFELVGDGDGGGGVEDVVSAGDMKFEGAEGAGGGVDEELGEAGFARDGGGYGQKFKTVVGFGGFAIGVNAAMGTGQDGFELGVVNAGGDGAVEGHFVHEVEVGALDVGHVAVAIHVFAVEVGDDGEDGGEFEEGAVAFIGFGDEVLGGAEAGVGAEGVDASSDYDGGVKAAGGEDRGDHGGGGGFAVHAGDGDAVFEAHEFGEHFGALDDGDFAGVCFEDFWVEGTDGGAGDDNCGVADVGGCVALVDGGAEGGESIGNGSAAKVRAGDGDAEVEEDFGDTAHADSADADEVRVLGCCEH